ncbi:MAG: hypothetical protein IT516_00975 [Burkholderiales bacterium]|nr:hypothetical protein [Burkholderiales bacterium]
MPNPESADATGELARFVRELDEAEIYAQKLRARIVAIRDALADGHEARALSLCNAALNEIDDATDVVTPPRPADQQS